MAVSGIYKIENKLNGKLYIGSSYNINERKSKHYYDLRNNKHHSITLQRSYNKHGEDNFIFEIIEECLIENLLSKEIFYIEQLNPFYNSAHVINSPYGSKRTFEQKQKLSMIRKQEYNSLTEEEKYNRYKHLLGWNKGKKMPEGMSKKLSERNILDDRGKKLSEIKKIMIEKGEYQYRKTVILQFDRLGNFIKEYERIIDAAKAMNKKSTGFIVNCCKGRKPSAYGFIWKYKNETACQ